MYAVPEANTLFFWETTVTVSLRYARHDVSAPLNIVIDWGGWMIYSLSYLLTRGARGRWGSKKMVLWYCLASAHCDVERHIAAACQFSRRRVAVVNTQVLF